MHAVTPGTRARLGLGLMLAVALAGCGGGSAAPAATFTEIYPLIFPRATKAQCTFCHGLPSNDKSNGNLSVGADKASAYASLMATSTSSMCGGNQPLIVPGDPDTSLFFLKLTTPPCGGRMPLGGDPLTAEQLAMVRSWIEAGAQDD